MIDDSYLEQELPPEDGPLEQLPFEPDGSDNPGGPVGRIGDHSGDISFKGSGRCYLCGCGSFVWPTSGSMCYNCGHDRSHHGL